LCLAVFISLTNAYITSLMDLGIVLGALLAAGLAGRFAPSLKIPLASLMAADIGGLRPLFFAGEPRPVALTGC